jgi:hypothetical protein
LIPPALAGLFVCTLGVMLRVQIAFGVGFIAKGGEALVARLLPRLCVVYG